jgi:predicted O-methyltransferase YrrM
VGDSDIFLSFEENLRSADVAEMIEAHRGASLDVAAELVDFAFHTIFIDGDHSFEGTHADLVAWYPLLETNGRMFGHDAVPDGGVHAALKQFVTERGLRWRIIEPPDAHYIWEILPSR